MRLIGCEAACLSGIREDVDHAKKYTAEFEADAGGREAVNSAYRLLH